jgi:hypothetical protein
MIRGTGGAEDALVGFLRTAISGVVAGLEISCGVAMTASYGIKESQNDIADMVNAASWQPL